MVSPRSGLAGFSLALPALLSFISPPVAYGQVGGGHAHAHATAVQPAERQRREWSDPKTWSPERVSAAGDRVLVARGTKVLYDVKSEAVLRLVQIVGTLTFARDRDTQLSVGVLKVQNSDECSESGFACDFPEINAAGEPQAPRQGTLPTLEVGTLQDPIPQHTARIRLHCLAGMDKKDGPAIVCCAARMDFHGAAMSRTWLDLGKTPQPGDNERCPVRGGDGLARRRRGAAHGRRSGPAARGAYRPPTPRRAARRGGSPRSTA